MLNNQYVTVMPKLLTYPPSKAARLKALQFKERAARLTRHIQVPVVIIH